MRWFYRLLIWAGPLLVLLVMVTGGFLYWALGTEAGTRWLLVTTARQFDGEARDVRGSIMDGVQVGNLSLSLPDVSVRAQDFRLQVEWLELLERRLHVRELAARALAVEVRTSDEPVEPSEPFRMPALPVTVALDRLALGQFDLVLDGQPLPVGIADLDTSLALAGDTGQLVLRSLSVAHDMANVRLHGDLSLTSLQTPWPAHLSLVADAAATRPESPLCVPAFVPTAAAGAPAAADCAVQLQLQADGSLDALAVSLKGSGQGLQLDAATNLLPSAVFPLKDAHIDLQLGDGSSVVGDAAWQVEPGKGTGALDGTHRVAGTLRVERLDIGRLVGDAIPPAVLGADSRFNVQLRDGQFLDLADLDLRFLEGSRWNNQPLGGTVRLQARNVAPPPAAAASAETPDATTAPADTAVAAQAQTPPPAARATADADAAPVPPVPAVRDDGPMLPAFLADWRLPVLALDVTLGGNRVALDGALGNDADRLRLDIAAPSLAAFWPEVPGGLRAQGQAGGSVARHMADLKAVYTPAESKANELGSGPMQADIAVAGGWSDGRPAGATPAAADASPRAEGWRGRIERLEATHAGIQVSTLVPLTLSWLPHAPEASPQWTVGPTQVRLSLDKEPLLTLDHQQSSGGHGRWQTRGSIPRLHVTDARIAQLRKRFDMLSGQGGVDRGGVTVRSNAAQRGNDITLGLDWNLRFADALEGTVDLRRLSGDLVIPAEPPVPVGLQDLQLDIRAVRAAAQRSTVQANAVVRTEKMGTLTVQASTPLHATAAGGLFLEPADRKVVEARAEVADLGWLSLFSDLPAELGGAITANVTAESQPDGKWLANGQVSGQNIRVIYPDEGVRLLDGTLQARFENERFILESLRFPARLRVEPQEWRTQEWVSTNPDAKGGSLTISGEWNLMDSVGSVGIDLYRYPILQRSDRYGMFTGKIQVDANLPSVSITGGITADAGWVDLDIVSGVPSLDGDVVVLRAGQQKADVRESGLDMSMDLTVDLGPRFYITGYGVNSGLVGQLRLLMRDGRLIAEGALNTRGGAIEVYGQRLQLRRGTITFQGDIASPVLDIEAVRSGNLAVQAGVRVVGTARRPQISLISYPEVSESEKLSWLLLGRGPDDGGGDAALLFSVGTSFLASGEPFYRRFGLDELSMRSGALGATGSVLPVEGVVGVLNSGASDIENKFIVASKTLSQGFTVSVEQAVSDTGTVARVSYRLARGLTAQISAGTVNGLALVYRWFSRD